LCAKEFLFRQQGKSCLAVELGAIPFRSSTMAVEDGWIDYNGHLNMAFYSVLFDRAVDELFDFLGIGRSYAESRKASLFALEAHRSYQRELKAGDRVVIDVQILDHDEKRLHFFQTMIHAEGGFIAATCEQAGIHIDLTTRRSAAFPADAAARIAALAGDHAPLPRPERAGRAIGLGRRKA
jgi:acyl-CoA thioester hydrolase